MVNLQQIAPDLNETPTITPRTTVCVPEHLLLEQILPRFPVKSLIRFKCVSKLWHSTISSSDFAISHLKFRPSFPRQFVILTERKDGTRKLMLLAYDELNNLKPRPVEFEFPFVDYCDGQPIPIPYTKIVGSCHGLICYVVDRSNSNNPLVSSHFSICNPATFQHSHIPNPYSHDNCLSDYWFGCSTPSNSIHDHKIVARFSSHTPPFMPCYVYSLRTAIWNPLHDPDWFLDHESFTHYTRVFNGILYFSPIDLFDELRPKHIIGLDLANDQLKIFSWMDWLSRYIDATFFVMNGCLSLYCCVEDQIDRIPQIYDVWMMKQHDNWSSWEKLYTVDLGGWTLRSITPTGMFLVNHYRSSSKDDSKIIDPSKNTQDLLERDAYFCDHSIIKGCIVGAVEGYVETLCSPFRSSNCTEEKDHEGSNKQEED